MAKNSNNLFQQEPLIKYVQCEGLAVMKIVKHCHEDSMSNVDVAQGALLGLVVDDCLEITNCFPFPKQTDENGDEEEYQLNMMRKLRRVNVDHFHVGWYQSANVGNFLSIPLLDSQYHYQTSIEESVVVVYDNNKSSRGFLSLKAYRLTPQAIEMYKENDFSNETVLKLKIGYENLLVEIPVYIRNSPLINIMLSELLPKLPEEESYKFLDLGTDSVLEENLRSLMDRVDELNQEAIKFNKYQQLVSRSQQDKLRYTQRRLLENQARIEKGEPPLPEDDLDKLFKPIPAPSRVNPMIVAGQIDLYGKNVSQFCVQSLSKLYTTKALQIAKEVKSNQI